MVIKLSDLLYLRIPVWVTFVGSGVENYSNCVNKEKDQILHCGKIVVLVILEAIYPSLASNFVSENTTVVLLKSFKTFVINVYVDEK